MNYKLYAVDCFAGKYRKTIITRFESRIYKNFNATDLLEDFRRIIRKEPAKYPSREYNKKCIELHNHIWKPELKIIKNR